MTEPTPNKEDAAATTTSATMNQTSPHNLIPHFTKKSALKKQPMFVSTTTTTTTNQTMISSSPVHNNINKEKGGGIESENKKKALKWDEHAIEKHDALRGTRMKIDEPKTPFNYLTYGTDLTTPNDSNDNNNNNNSSSSPRTPPRMDPFGQSPSAALQWNTLESKLATVAAAREQYPTSPSSANSQDNDDDEDITVRREKIHEQEFKIHRKNHYNEMEAVRRFQMEHADDDDDEEEEDKDDDEAKPGTL